MPLYEFKCQNPKCLEPVFEEMVKLDELETTEVLCSTCGTLCSRVISPLKTKHGSWSTWRVGLGN